MSGDNTEKMPMSPISDDAESTKRHDSALDKSADATVEVKLTSAGSAHIDLDTVVEFKLYKRRWVGLATIVLFNIVSGCNGQFFGPISIRSSEYFGVSLTQMNWLSNAVNLAYLPSSFLASWVLSRVGIRYTLLLGGVYLLIATLLRLAATAPGISPGGAYAVLVICQLFVALAQPCVQIIMVKFSESWFDLRGRMTATMFCSVANPLGGVVGSLLLPALPDTKWAIYAGAIIAVVLFPVGFLLQDQPPTPPTLSGSKKSPPMKDTFLAVIGKVPVSDPSYMEFRDRLDFIIMFFCFGILVAATGTWSNFSNQTFEPFGYTASQSGLMDTTLFGAGILATFVSSPLFDRWLSSYIGITMRILLPILAGCWLSFIWTIKPNSYIVYFPIFAIIGICSFILLPVALEIAAEVTRNSETSCTLLWFSVNLFSFAYILIEDALRAGPDANPPFNMRQATIFHSSCITVTAAMCVFGLRARQTRRLEDEAAAKEVKEILEENPRRSESKAVTSS